VLGSRVELGEDVTEQYFASVVGESERLDDEAASLFGWVCSLVDLPARQTGKHRVAQ